MHYLHDRGDDGDRVTWSQMKKGECSVGTKKKVTFSATTASLESADKCAKAVEKAVAKVDNEAAREAEHEEREHAKARAARRATEATIKEDAYLKSDGNVRKGDFCLLEDTDGVPRPLHDEGGVGAHPISILSVWHSALLWKLC